MLLTAAIATASAGAAFSGENFCVAEAAQNSGEVKISGKIKIPEVSVKNNSSEAIVFNVRGAEKYKENPEFQILCKDKIVRKVSAKTVKKYGKITVTNDGEKYLSSKKAYVFKVRVKNSSGLCSESKTVKVKTAAKTYYKVKSKTTLYKKSGEKLVSTGKKTSSEIYVTGRKTASDGISNAGKSISRKNEFVYISSGENKGRYVKYDRAALSTERDAKINKVVNYAVGMNGGRYVYGGERYRATDCSGLTMLSYRQVGINLTHSAARQAKKGKANSVKNIKKGDVIICNGGSHAALYIGNGKIIHAMTPYYGIKIQRLSDLRYVGRITAVRTII